MKNQVVLLNDLYPELDEDINGYFYEQETEGTGVIYRIENIMEGKSYIGKAYSFIKHYDPHRKKNNYKHGAKGRFKTHWYKKSCNNLKQKNDCPIFYQALRNSDIHDWFIFTLKTCPKKELKKWETLLIKKYKTSDPKFGYNYFVGNNKPNNKEYLLKYQTSKEMTNVNRAKNSKMKRTECNKKLPTYISYYPIKEKGKIIREGYMARIKINGKLYKKIFISMEESMKIKLEKAKKFIDLVISETNKQKSNGSKSNKILKNLTAKGTPRKIEESKNLPKNIRYLIFRSNGKIQGKGYSVEITINKKRYKKIFISNAESMETKLEKAKKQLKIFKADANKKNVNN